MKIRQSLEKLEQMSLSPKACLSLKSRGRVRPEAGHPLRTAFQRDRDRIVHCKSFRRLKHKTQVFLAPFGDHYRTRLTHTLEVSQIARTMARALRLNEDLTEAIALGHDLGHTPFGHSGEETLRKLLPGGFTHYEQSLRVVDKLEYDGKGLNLTHEVRDGILKHSKGRGEILNTKSGDMPETLEGQLVRISDVIAYINHDLDDAARAGIIKDGDIPARLVKKLGKYHAFRIDAMVMDVVRTSLHVGLERITMSPEMMESTIALRDFLYDRVYLSQHAQAEHFKARKILIDLYRFILANPAGYLKAYPPGDPPEKRAGDFIASMSDRYALALFEKLFFLRAWPF